MRYIIAILVLVISWLLYQASGPKQLPALPDAEQNYYWQVFDYTMTNIQPGSHFDWKTYDADGSISVTVPFVSKSGYTCRSFRENYTVAGQSVSDKGYGCKRIGKDGWCKLHTDDALTCALENPAYHMNGPNIGSTPGAPNVNIDTSINGGSTGAGFNVNAPRTNSSNKPSATDAASTITGAAGNAAGYVAKNAGGWFSGLFR